MKRINQKGFTIIELMIASLVFSVILILCMTGLIQIGRLYYKGLTQTRTQEAARGIIDEISQGIQFSGDAITTTGPSPPTAPYVLCIDNKHYSVYRGKQLTDGTPNADQSESRHALVRDTVASGCPAALPLNSNTLNLGAYVEARELLPAGMRIAKLTVVEDVANRLFTITVRVVSGDGDLLTNPSGENAACSGVRAAGQFCAVSELSTVVQKRL